jgi:hypothetical protein
VALGARHDFSGAGDRLESARTTWNIMAAVGLWSVAALEDISVSIICNSLNAIHPHDTWEVHT